MKQGMKKINPPFVRRAVTSVRFEVIVDDALAKVTRVEPSTLIVDSDSLSERRLALSGRSITYDDPTTVDVETPEMNLKKNLTIWLDGMKTMIHESMHAATYLLENSTKGDPINTRCRVAYLNILTDEDYIPDRWDAPATRAAEENIEKMGLQEGFIGEWCRMHKQFVEAKLSEEYDPALTVDNPTARPLKGFISEYGRADPYEEIAEIASLIQFNHHNSLDPLTVIDLPHLDPNIVVEADRRRYGHVEITRDYHNVCKEQLQTTQKLGLKDLAALYTKINLLLDLGFITKDAYNTCIGTGKVGLENGGKVTTGFHVLDFETGAFKHSYELTNIGHAPVSSGSDERSFILIGKGSIEDGGKVNNMDMWLRFNKTITNESEKKYNLPRGIYKLDWNWQLFPGQAKVTPCPPLFSETDAPLTFYVNVEDAPSRSFCTVIGQILVTRSSKDFFEATLYAHKVLKRVGGSPVQLPSPMAVAGIPVPFLAGGVLIPEVRNFRVYIRWRRDGSE
jgi:hypothetical protein